MVCLQQVIEKKFLLLEMDDRQFAAMTLNLMAKGAKTVGGKYIIPTTLDKMKLQT